MKYISLKVHFCFSEPMDFKIRPLYLVRSMLGSSLHALCCSEKDKLCTDCKGLGKCMYSTFFDGVVNEQEKKRVHPFSLHLLDRTNGIPMNDYSFVLKIYGEYQKMLPYIIAAFVRAGDIGAGKEKVKFEVEVSDLKGSPVTNDMKPEEWDENINSYTAYNGKLLIRAISPVRFKSHEIFTTDFSAQDFLLALRRRYISLISNFGTKEPVKDNISNDIQIFNRQLKWNEANHWSSRQQTKMKIGGAVGTFELEGHFSAYEMMLLDFATHFSVGKNVSFGLGNIESWKKC